MSIVIRHTCKRCKRPVRNPKGMDWVHIDGTVGHKIVIKVTRV